MVEAECHRCGREWDYTGRSDHYGTCPNCKTSVKLGREGERGEPSETAETEEDCPDPSDGVTVRVEAGGEGADEMAVGEAVEKLDQSVSELYRLGEDQGRTSGDLARRADDLEAAIEEVGAGVAELVEAMGGSVNWESDLLEEPDPDRGPDPESGIVGAVEAAEEGR